MNRFESKEDYLERILVLSRNNNLVRAIDIANDMNYSKPSVSIALKKLKNDGFIVVDDQTGNVKLTESGEKIAVEIYERHTIVSSVLIKLGVSENVAKDDACKIEHDISEETFLKLKEFLKND